MALKRRLTDEFCDDFRPIKRISVHGIKESDDHHQEEETASSVGSNHPIHELIIISDDDDDDEVESPPSTADEVESPPSTVDEWRETERPSLASKETENKCNEEEGDLWVKYGSMIVDDNGFLLGEFRQLDEDLYKSIMAD